MECSITANIYIYDNLINRNILKIITKYLHNRKIRCIFQYQNNNKIYDIMKLPHYSDQQTMVYDITNYLREKIHLTAEQAGLLRFCLEDNILMTIEIDEKVYRTPWRYYRAFVEAFDTCCGICNEETLFEVERSKTELINNSQRLSYHANKF